MGLGFHLRLLSDTVARGHGASGDWARTVNHHVGVERTAWSEILFLFVTQLAVLMLDFACFLSLATAPPIFAWMSDLSPHDAEQRAFIIGFSIAFYCAVGECPHRLSLITGAWSNVLIWPASQVPHYRVAWQCSIALWCLVIIELGLLPYTEIRWIRPGNMRIAAERYSTEPVIDPRKIADDEHADSGKDGKESGIVERVQSI